jgi:hypothetical protein
VHRYARTRRSLCEDLRIKLTKIANDTEPLNVKIEQNPIQGAAADTQGSLRSAIYKGKQGQFNPWRAATGWPASAFVLIANRLKEILIF